MSATPTVLVVEYDDDFGFLLEQLCRNEGWGVCRARTTIDAVGCLAHHRVDAVLLDLGLPTGPNGISLLRALYTYPTTVPVVVVSGKSGDSLEGDEAREAVLAMVQRGAPDMWHRLRALVGQLREAVVSGEHLTLVTQSD